MKVHAKQTFVFKMELNRDEAEAVREALNYVADIRTDDAEENDITLSCLRTVKELAPVVEEALRERNWRE